MYILIGLLWLFILYVLFKKILILRKKVQEYEKKMGNCPLCRPYHPGEQEFQQMIHNLYFGDDEI